ncbi:porin [Aquabacterium sp.]|uniref:porin n=1 Tax=Aquabacterium sp. TaxID=1872578 RepID=UPI001E14213B|nr:porin [Aquabacterium sp.]MBT9608478.1 porin [Aquabacterium sp.]|tara:strand:+ start:939 stop:2075 length:1137 start_codon:yes stop_codon:yes gene_type:complete
MKKTVLALAAIAASSAAFAQSSVTLYGLVDASVESVKGNTAGKGTTFNRVSSGNLVTSRLGFKGVEDLGGGLKAKFQLEAAVSADTGASASGGRFFDRAAWVGLASAEAGELRIGRQDSLIGAQIVDAIGAYAYDASVVAVTLGGSTFRRIDNALTYIAPTFVPGLTVSAQYSTAMDSNTANNAETQSGTPGSVIGRGFGFSANFVQGPLSAGASYIQVNSANKAATTGEQENVGLFIYGAYDLGVAKLTAYYNDDSNDGNRRFDGRRLYGINAAVPVATGLTVSGGYGYARNVGTTVSTTGFAANALTGVTGKNAKNDNAGIITLKAQYDLSKRTAAYALFTQVQNSDKANLALVNATTQTADKSSRGLAVGIRHAF